MIETFAFIYFLIFITGMALGSILDPNSRGETKKEQIGSIARWIAWYSNFICVPIFLILLIIEALS